MDPVTHAQWVLCLAVFLAVYLLGSGMPQLQLTRRPQSKVGIVTPAGRRLRSPTCAPSHTTPCP